MNLLRKKSKKNNKGFSLVELIICVAVLGIVVVPLLRAFTTSAQLTSKSRKIGQATTAAQNIQEVIEAYGVDAMLSDDSAYETDTGKLQNVNVLNTIYGSNYDVDNTTVDTANNQLILNGIKSGTQTFDAKVTFRTDKTTGIAGVNGSEIAQYVDMAGTFSQPYAANQNPDRLAENELFSLAKKDDYGSPELTITGRSIRVDFKSTESEDGGYDVTADVTFYYYGYYTAINGREVSADYRQNIFINNNYDQVPLTSYTYNIFPNGYHIDSYDEEVDCYVMYYPYYGYYDYFGDFWDLDEDEHIDFYVDYTNNDSDLKAKLFLVKLWPMIPQDDGSYEKADDTDEFIQNFDHQYNFNLSEYHNNNFNLIKDGTNTADKSMMNIYTNANTYFANGVSHANYTYRIKRLSQNGFFVFSRASKVTNQLVKTEAEDRYYDVTISLYSSGADMSSDTPIYTLTANNLK